MKKISYTIAMLLTGAFLSSIVGFYAFASTTVEIQEANYNQSVLMLKDYEAKYDKLIEARTHDIQSVMQEYQPAVLELNKLKKQAKKLICGEEAQLAQAKLVAHYQDKLSLTTQDVQRLNEKSEWTCGQVSPNESLEVAPEVKVAATSPTPVVQSAAVLLDKKLCEKKDVDEDQNQYVRMAAEISNNDLDFLATLNQENGTWDPKRKAFGNEDSWGFCMFNRIWHSKTVDDPRFFTEPAWQMQKCYEAYKGGTRFYGFDVRKNSYDKFTCPNQ